MGLDWHPTSGVFPMSGSDRPTQKSDEPGKGGAEVKAEEALAGLRDEIARHEKIDASRSYLGRAISSLSRQDEESLAALKQSEEDLRLAIEGKNRAKAGELAASLTEKIERDRQSLARQDEYAHYGAGFLKAAALFMRGKSGLVGTGLTYALDQMNPGDTPYTQMLDGTLGTTKGLVLKGIFSRLGQAEVGIAAKGVGLGVSSRLAETAFTRHTYLSADGQFDGLRAMETMRRTALAKEALAADVVIFTLSHGLIKGGSSITGGALERSPLAANMLTAGSFGLVSGAGGEIQRQLGEGQSFTSFDYSKIAQRALIQGSLDTLAGLPGGLQARAAQTPTLEAIRQAGETRATARQLAADTRLFEIGESSLSQNFFSHLGKALKTDAAPAERARLFGFMERNPQIHAGVGRFAASHPDLAVKSVIADYFNTRRLLTAEPEPKASLASAELTGDSSRKPAPDEPRREAAGVYGYRDRGGLWQPERNIDRLSPEQRSEAASFARSPLFQHDALDLLSRHIMDSTGRWHADLSPMRADVDRAYKTYEQAVLRYQEDVVRQGLVPVQALTAEKTYERQIVHEHLAGQPELLRVFENYVEAREMHGQKLRVLKEEVHLRARSLEHEVNKFTQAAGLPRIKIVLRDELGSANARYSAGKGIIELLEADFHDVRDTSGLVRKVTHELTHMEQDFTMIRRAADLTSKGEAGTEPVSRLRGDEVFAVQKFYEARLGYMPDFKFVVTCLFRRNNRRLTADEAARADELFAAFKQNKPPGQEYVELGNDFRTVKRQLDKLESINEPLLLAMRLGGSGQEVLSRRLFGQPEPPPEIARFIPLAKEVMEGSNPEVVWPREQVRAAFRRLIEPRLAEINNRRIEMVKDYMKGLHEKEAWVVAERGRLIAEARGATKPDTGRQLTEAERDLIALTELLDPTGSNVVILE